MNYRGMDCRERNEWMDCREVWEEWMNGLQGGRERNELQSNMNYKVKWITEEWIAVERGMDCRVKWITDEWNAVERGMNCRVKWIIEE